MQRGTFLAGSTAAIGAIPIAARAQSPVPVRVALISRTFFFVPFWIAQQRGLFAANGLTVDGEILDSATRATQGLKDGTFAFSIAPTEGVIEDVENGTGTLRIVAGNTSKLSHFLIAQKRFRRIEDLKGATIGCVSLTEGSAFHFRTMAAAHGLEYPRDYTLKAVGGAPTRWELLQKNEIDAGLQSIPLSYIAEDAGFPNLGAITEYIPQYQFTTVNANGPYLERNRGVAVRFLRALIAATRTMYAEPDLATQTATREMQVAPKYAARAYADFTRLAIMPADCSVSEPGLAAVVTIMQKAGTIAAGSPHIGKYLDLAYLGAAQRA